MAKIIDGDTGQVIEHEESLAHPDPSKTDPLLKAFASGLAAFNRDPIRATLGLVFGFMGLIVHNAQLPVVEPPKKRKRTIRRKRG